MEFLKLSGKQTSPVEGLSNKLGLFGLVFVFVEIVSLIDDR